MRKIIRFALGIAGAIILIAYSLPLAALILNAGNIFGILVGIAMILSSIFLDRIISIAKKHRIIAGIICVCVLCFAIIFGTTYKSIVDYAQYTASDENVVIVLGCKVDDDRPSLMLKWRCDEAIKYLQSNPNAVAILSGGQGKDEKISEAECMRIQLTNAGIDESRLYIEDKSTSTNENIAFSQKIIEDNNLSTNIAIATSDYHEKRASIIARKNGLTASSIPAKGDKYSRLTFFTREVFGVWMQYIS